MMRLSGLAILLILLSSTFGPAALAQTSDDERRATEQRLEELRQLIEEDQRRLSETREAVESSEQTLENLNREIAMRQELVDTYQRRLQQLNQEEDSLRTSLQHLEGQIEELREEYRERARHAYKHGRMHDLALIFASNSINQMLVRVRYLRRFAEQRRGRLSEIQETTAQLQRQREQLDDRRAETMELLREAESERQNLTSLQRERRQVVEQLRSQQSSLREDIDERQRTAEQLEGRLRRMIARETARQREADRGSATARAEFVELTGSFAENQGQLPWPAPGVVEENFGTVVNPVHGTSTPNPGVLIATSPQAEVLSVFEGRVINVDAMPDLGTTVFVQHGEYTTVYGNFSMLYVGKDDRVSAGQVLGRAGTEEEPRGAGIFFALFKDGEAIDPNRWLRSR